MSRKVKRDKLLKPKSIVRKEVPVIGRQGRKTVIMCPFCPNPHAISAEEISQCGTFLEVHAVQRIYKNVTCALCGKKDGELIRAGNYFVHIKNCTPGKVLYAHPPKKSVLAKMVFILFPEKTHLWFGNRFGKVPMKLFDTDQKAVGYAWQPVLIKKVEDAKDKKSVS